MKPVKVPQVLLSISLLLFLTQGCAIYHHYGEFTGKVIDAETKEPLEGVAVLAIYNTEQYGLAGSISYYVDAQEMVTDKNGEFRIPPLNAVAFRPLSSFEPYVWFRIFKPGYGCYPENKKVKPMFLPGGTLPAKQYVTVELPKLTTREERIESTDCSPDHDVPLRKCKAFQLLINKENIDLGLGPERRD
jgi:hypothetical protein